MALSYRLSCTAGDDEVPDSSGAFIIVWDREARVLCRLLRGSDRSHEPDGNPRAGAMIEHS